MSIILSDADQARQAHRTAATDEDAALPLRQREIGRGFGDTDMRRAGELQPASDHGAPERGDHRHAAVLDAVEHPVPHLGMEKAATGIMVGQFGEVETAGKMVADAVDDDGADILGQGRKTLADLQDDAVVERIALGRPIEADGQNPVRPLDLQKPGGARVSGLGVSLCHLRPCQNSYVV
ncbi:hypothetical protein ACVWZV_000531 [Bradyrhizobium sp. GM5.1]